MIISDVIPTAGKTVRQRDLGRSVQLLQQQQQQAVMSQHPLLQGGVKLPPQLTQSHLQQLSPNASTTLNN